MVGPAVALLGMEEDDGGGDGDGDDDDDDEEEEEEEEEEVVEVSVASVEILSLRAAGSTLFKFSPRISSFSSMTKSESVSAWKALVPSDPFWDNVRCTPKNKRPTGSCS